MVSELVLHIWLSMYSQILLRHYQYQHEAEFGPDGIRICIMFLYGNTCSDLLHLTPWTCNKVYILRVMFYRKRPLDNAWNMLCYLLRQEWFWVKLTNWIPVSLRIPTPAEAKLAPTSSLCPVSCGLKYGSGDSWLPIFWPGKKNESINVNLKLVWLRALTPLWRATKTEFIYEDMHSGFIYTLRMLKSFYGNSADNIRNIEAIGETASGPSCGIVNAIRWGVCASRSSQIVVVPTVHKGVAKHEKGSAFNAPNIMCQKKP